ncbi:hypothetical protein J7I98_31685 [Streptomyces sp. ISL-98]|uniref:hypothetical protein n=1 Tax=Streptomyces sp. ISL-98 TaxID=2819192 RepID=UPI001BECFAF5|nr:hypothetical protein [Streptomyces sp. ISL-98]MBT2510337.1 hypothetical protein [Streptomyces sp. ISL-98]
MDEQTGYQGGAAPGPGSYPPPPQGFGPPPPAYAPAPQAQQPYAPSPYAAPAPYAPQMPVAPTPAPAPAPAPAPGPEFLAADRRNAVVVDAEGVSFEWNGATADFPWRDIQTVHFKQGPQGLVLMVAVVLPDGRFYEGAVLARNQGKLHEWFAELAPVLGFYLAGRGN